MDLVALVLVTRCCSVLYVDLADNLLCCCLNKAAPVSCIINISFRSQI